MPASTSQRRTKPKVRRNSDVIRWDANVPEQKNDNIYILTYFSFKCKENKGINIYVNICCFKTARC